MEIIKSYGKINLSLEVLSKRTDGYHNIDSLMTKIDLHDVLTFTILKGDDLFLETNCQSLPLDSTNLVYKAWEILKPFSRENTGIKINIKKNIPLASGLGGGTSNGVETMKVLNNLWNLDLSTEELIELAKPLGADSTFFFYDNLIRAQGIGEKITKLGPMPYYPVLLVKIDQGLSSKDIYENMTTYSHGKVEDLVNNIKDFDYVLKHSYNNMENVSFKKLPHLQCIKDELVELGAVASLMTGAGPTIFGVFKDLDSQRVAYEKLKNKYNTVIKTRII